MLDIRYLDYIPSEKREEAHKSLLRTIFYFYNGVYKDDIRQLNGNILDVSKENLIST
jgi:hypothetical protein